MAITPRSLSPFVRQSARRREIAGSTRRRGRSVGVLPAAAHIGPQAGDILVTELVAPGRHGAALAVEHRTLEALEVVLGKFAQVEAQRAGIDHVASVAGRAQLAIGVAAL